MAENCKNCGLELFVGQRFCRSCGASTEEFSSERVPTQMMPPNLIVERSQWPKHRADIEARYDAGL